MYNPFVWASNLCPRTAFSDSRCQWIAWVLAGQEDCLCSPQKPASAISGNPWSNRVWHQEHSTSLPPLFTLIPLLISPGFPCTWSLKPHPMGAKHWEQVIKHDSWSHSDVMAEVGNGPAEMEVQMYFGECQKIFRIEIPQSPQLCCDPPETAALNTEIQDLVWLDVEEWSPVISDQSWSQWMIGLALKYFDSARINCWVRGTRKLHSSPLNFPPMHRHNTCSTEDELLRRVEALGSQPAGIYTEDSVGKGWVIKVKSVMSPYLLVTSLIVPLLPNLFPHYLQYIYLQVGFFATTQAFAMNSNHDSLFCAVIAETWSFAFIKGEISQHHYSHFLGLIESPCEHHQTIQYYGAMESSEEWRDCKDQALKVWSSWSSLVCPWIVLDPVLIIPPVSRGCISRLSSLEEWIYVN